VNRYATLERATLTKVLKLRRRRPSARSLY
jgi:hypothetical protein